MPRVAGDKHLMCEGLGKFAEDCNQCITRVRRAKSETDECPGENKFVLSSLFSIC